MSDDAEGRARIEAGTAARRSDLPASGPDGGATADGSPATQGPRALAPARPWLRAESAGSPSGSPPAAPPLPPSDGPGPSGLGPVRPWLLRGVADTPPRGLPEPVPPADGRLRPARPWADRAAVPAEAAAGPAPSNPETVLRGLVEEEAQARAAAVAEPIDTLPSRPEAEEYPWQRRDEVDLDLHGAPTWDPAMYPPEDDEAPGRRGRKALAWMFARRPEDDAEAEQVEQEAEPETAAAVVAEAPRYQPEPVPEPPSVAAVAETEADAVAEPAAPAAPVAPVVRRGGLGRLLGRRRDVEEDVEEPYESFDLPEPDAAFERPWLQVPPRPTRDWDLPLGTSLPASEPGPGTEPSRAAVPEPEPAPEPEPEPTPAQPAPRPGPGAAPRRRPRPGPAVAVSGISGAVGGYTPAHAATGGTISGATPDLSRFLQATEPRPEDEDDDERDDSGTGGGGDGGGGGSGGRSGGGRFSRGSRLRRTLVRSLSIIAVAALAAVLLRVFVVQPYYIPSASMEPTLHGCPTCNDDRILVDKFSYRIHSPRVRDIVVFHRPRGDSSPESVLIKRIVAVSGDVVQLRDGLLFVNGLEVDEPYVNKNCGAHPTQPLTNVSKWTVPDNDVFVLGDNRCDSHDSRAFGPIPVSSIIGRAFAIIWPVNRIRLL